MDKKDINRLKIVLIQKGKTKKWLAEQLGVNPSNVSRWTTNESQPSIETFIKMSRVLNVDIRALLNLEEDTM